MARAPGHRRCARPYLYAVANVANCWLISAIRHLDSRMPTRRTLTPDVAALLEPLPANIRALVGHVRALVFTSLPKVVETADPKARILGYGYGEGYRDTVATIILSKKGVKLGLVESATFPDPHGLLAGTGKVHRHIAFTNEDEVARPAVKALLLLALAAWKERTIAGN